MEATSRITTPKTPRCNLFFVLSDRIKALEEILSLFSKANISLSHIESRPSSKTINYNAFTN